MTTLLKVNENGPAHLQGFIYKKSEDPTLAALGENYIAVEVKEKPADYFFAESHYLESILRKPKKNEPYGWDTTSWTGAANNTTYAMPRSWFTALPPKPAKPAKKAKKRSIKDNKKD